MYGKIKENIKRATHATDTQSHTTNSIISINKGIIFKFIITYKRIGCVRLFPCDCMCVRVCMFLSMLVQMWANMYNKQLNNTTLCHYGNTFILPLCCSYELKSTQTCARMCVPVHVQVCLCFKRPNSHSTAMLCVCWLHYKNMQSNEKRDWSHWYSRKTAKLTCINFVAKMQKDQKERCARTLTNTTTTISEKKTKKKKKEWNGRIYASI